MSLLHPRILSQGIFVTTLTETKINSLFSFLLKHELFIVGVKEPIQAASNLDQGQVLVSVCPV